MTAGVTSASRVEAYATCPLKYFFGYVLNVEPTDKPEETIYLPPDRRGTFVHEILEKYLKIRMERSLPPSEEILREAFHAIKIKWERDEPIGNRTVWQIETEDLQRRLMRWLDEEQELHAKGFKPDGAEVAFGRGENPYAEVPLDDGSSLTFTGVIDRVDKHPDGRVYVFDYKTGRATSYNGVKSDPVDGGRHLQLGLYAGAAQQIHNDATDTHAAYWFVFDRKNQLLPAPEAFDFSEASDGLQKVARVITRGTAQGHFPPNPGKAGESCRNCNFERVCPSEIRRARMLENHRRDSRLDTYFGMVEGEAEPS
jgi:ATP-dependent helicase/DNAse subunit B